MRLYTLLAIYLLAQSSGNSVAIAQSSHHYSVSYIGSALSSGSANMTKIAVDFGPANRNPYVMSAVAALAAGKANISMLKQRVKQSLLTAQEELLPLWARWKPFRPSDPANPWGDDGSYKDWKTTEENDSSDSLTWVNEFFHPSAFVRRNTRYYGTSGRNTTLMKDVFYQDYDPFTGVPYDETTPHSLSVLTTLRNKHGNETALRRISELDMRPERTFFREKGGACRYSVPYFNEPLTMHEEGVQFFVTSEGALTTTSFFPCDYRGCNMDYIPWAGIYLQQDDLDPSQSDQNAMPLDPTRELSDDADEKHSEGFSGIWIDRYMYNSSSDQKGTASHGATSNNENLSDPNRQVSVVVTYENIPAFGVKSKSNFTGQIEVFTNGTFILRYRSLAPLSPRGAAKPQSTYPNARLISPFLHYSTQMEHLTDFRQVIFPYSYDEFNNTNLTSLPVVAIRFDLKHLTGHRATESTKASGRCPNPTAVSEALIPAGARGGTNYLSCGNATTCTSCMGRHKNARCVWCAGIRPNALATGLCMHSADAAAYCSPLATFNGSCSVPYSSHLPATLADYYNVSVYSLRSEQDFSQEEVVASGSDDEDILANQIASAMRGEMASFITRSSSLAPSGNLWNTLSWTAIDTPAKAPQFLRRQNNSLVNDRLKTSVDAAGSTPYSEADCYSTNLAYYGQSPTWPAPSTFDSYVGFMLPSPIPVMVNPDNLRSMSSSSAENIFSYSSAGAGIRLKPSSSVTVTLPLLEFGLQDTTQSNDERICRLQHTRNGTFSFSTVHKGIRHRYASYQADLFSHFSETGRLMMGCLRSEATPDLFFMRMVAGTDPFNVWYQQEATPPVSTSPTSLKAFLYSATYGGFVFSNAHLARPGRLLSYRMSKVCPFCKNGACDKDRVMCVCDSGFTGDFCDLCPVGYSLKFGKCEADPTKPKGFQEPEIIAVIFASIVSLLLVSLGLYWVVNILRGDSVAPLTPPLPQQQPPPPTSFTDSVLAVPLLDLSSDLVGPPVSSAPVELRLALTHDLILSNYVSDKNTDASEWYL